MIQAERVNADWIGVSGGYRRPSGRQAGFLLAALIVASASGMSAQTRGAMLSVRLTVLVLSVVAFLISLSSGGIKELVETASAFGSAGVFVATLFALFTRFGGSLSAYTSVGAGMLVWAMAKYGLGFETPYLIGLLSALTAYVGMALIEHRR